MAWITNTAIYSAQSNTASGSQFDGWRQVAELNATNNNLAGGFTWGLDLNGSRVLQRYIYDGNTGVEKLSFDETHCVSLVVKLDCKLTQYRIFPGVIYGVAFVAATCRCSNR